MSGFVICGKPQFSGEWVKLGDVASYINGYAFKPTDYASEGKPIIRIQDLTGNAYQTNRFAGNLDDKYRVVWGDVLISWSASLGVYVWSAEEAWLNQHIFKVQFNKLPVNKRFFIHQTRYVIAESATLAHGATMRHLTKKVFDNLPFFYPSEHDQDEIACHLDGIQLQIDSASEMLARLDTLVKSRFNEMFEGAAAERQSLSSIVWFQEGPGVRNYQYTSHGVKLLNVANLRDGKLDTSNTDRYISETEAYGRYKHFLVDAGDLIIASSGIKVEYFEKKMGFANKDQLPLCMNTSTIRFKPIDPSVIDMQYFMHYLKSEDFKRQLDRNITGSAQLNFGPSHLKRMTIPVPSIMLQRQFSEFVQHVDKLRFILFENPSPMFGHRSFCCSTNSGNGGVILEAKDY